MTRPVFGTLRRPEVAWDVGPLWVCDTQPRPPAFERVSSTN
jgi:hypothetical protein